MSVESALFRTPRRDLLVWLLILLGAITLILGVLLRRAPAPYGNAAGVASGKSQTSAVLDIAVLVFREGLECVLVLAAVTASFKGTQKKYHRPVAVGVAIAFVASLVTWLVVVRILADIGKSISALAVQAGTGLLAILVLLVVMNWFFHKLYWTGWISLHNQRKRGLLSDERKEDGELRVVSGIALLGFTSFYREGFEVVLFLQSYRLTFGDTVVLYAVVLGMFASGIVAVLTFVAHLRLPYRRMLVSTGLMLAFVLLVMVGEEAQEMQLARWLPLTEIPRLVHVIPSWMGLWFSAFPTVETLSAQALAGVLVFGSYFAARRAPPRSQSNEKRSKGGTTRRVAGECDH